jgi:hypothetical protein
MKNKKVLKPLIIAGTIIVILYSIIYSITLFFVYTAFRPVKPENSPDSPACITDPKDRLYHDAEYEINFHDEQKRSFMWLLSAAQTVSIKSYDGLNLNARFALQPDSHNYVILMHGFRDSTKYISSYAKMFYEKGFNVLVPGQRGHGWSEGNIVDMSAFTPYDVKSWTEFICSHDTEAKIAFWGVSMGGSTVMQATGLELPANVICCIEDCGFSSMWDEFVYQISNGYHLPGRQFMTIFNIYIKRHLKIDSKKVSAENAVSKSHIPTLFIHGDEDTYVPFFMLDIVYDAANCPKEKLVVEGGTHARAAFVNPELYWNTVFAFTAKYF